MPWSCLMEMEATAAPSPRIGLYGTGAWRRIGNHGQANGLFVFLITRDGGPRCRRCSWLVSAAATVRYGATCGGHSEDGREGKGGEGGADSRRELGELGRTCRARCGSAWARRSVGCRRVRSGRRPCRIGGLR